MSILKDWFNYTEPEKKQMKVKYTELEFEASIPTPDGEKYYLQTSSEGPEWVGITYTDSDWSMNLPIEVLKAMVANLHNLNKPVKEEVPF